MARYSRKTIHMDILESARTKNVPFVPLDYATLNQYFNLFVDEPRPAGYPQIGYLAIGNGGHAHASGNVGAALYDILEHEVTDARLFEHIPFIARPRNADLSPTERERYRIRKLLTVPGGQQYWVYYLRRVNFNSSSPTIEIISTTGGVTNPPIPFEATPAMLEPTPLPMVNGVVTGSTGRKISVQSPMSATLSEEDIEEIINACEIVYGDSRHAIISEVAIVSAFDKVVTNTEGGFVATYTEAIAAQCCTFIGDLQVLTRGLRNLTFSYELGNIQVYRH